LASVANPIVGASPVGTSGVISVTAGMASEFISKEAEVVDIPPEGGGWLARICYPL